MSELSRRGFLQETSAITAGAAAAANLNLAAAAQPAPTDVPFASNWKHAPGRVWIGPEFWSNPLQDWRLHDGRIECVNQAVDRNVHLLTRQLGPGDGLLTLHVTLGRVGGKLAGKGSAGFRIGIQGRLKPLIDYRSSLWNGQGLDAGITGDGRLFIGGLPGKNAPQIDPDRGSIRLSLRAKPGADGYVVTLYAVDPATNEVFTSIEKTGVSAFRLVGNIALVNNFGSPRRRNQPVPANFPGLGRFWFSDWRVRGTKVEAHDDRAYGPIFFSQYTLSNGTMKLTGQMPPVGDKDTQTVALELKKPGHDNWQHVAEETIHPQSRTVTFRIDNWKSTSDIPYRVKYALVTDVSGDTAQTTEYEWTGLIRKDPVDQDTLKVADISCNHHDAFPNSGYVANMAKLDPDLLAFVGDQFYEDCGGYGVVRKPLEPAILDYLRKWYFHGWTWRELMRDRPTLCIPDDHDVYQGNIWGESGAPETTTQEAGGYNMNPEWVNVVHRTQAAHHPDPYDPTPIRQNISVYYGPMTYGRISFAVIADRMFKIGPEGVVPPTGGRGDHVKDPNFDPKTADLPGLPLLGDRQMKFLRHWTQDWNGADMKAVISQTIFTAMATTHGGNREVLRADYDTNGWPQTARNDALREIRKAFAVHLAGDQHLPAVIQYGIDRPNDAGYAFAGPAVNVGYPRWWEPTVPGKNRPQGSQEFCGEFEDHFGHPMTVVAYVNGAIRPPADLLQRMRAKASGLGLVTFDKKAKTTTIECWPYLADPTADDQFPGWPVVVKMTDNDGRKPLGHLPKIRANEDPTPVVQVIEESTGEIVYTLRIPDGEFQPPVYSEGRYTVRITHPETGREQTLTGLAALSHNDAVIDVVWA